MVSADGDADAWAVDFERPEVCNGVEGNTLTGGTGCFIILFIAVVNPSAFSRSSRFLFILIPLNQARMIKWLLATQHGFFCHDQMVYTVPHMTEFVRRLTSV